MIGFEKSCTRPDIPCNLALRNVLDAYGWLLHINENLYRLQTLLSTFGKAYSKFPQRRTYFFKRQTVLGSYLKGTFGNSGSRFFIGF